MPAIKIEKYEDEQSWLDARQGRISGTKLKDIIVKRGTGMKKGFYSLIAERIAVPADQENVMDRGKRLEDEALDRFEAETKKELNRELVIIARPDEPAICYSPDAFIGETETVEVKCLNTASHIEAWLTKQVPKEYEEQVIQPFCVNDKLKTLYMVFYDPRLPKFDYFYLTIERKDVADKVSEYLEFQREVLRQIEKIEAELTF